MYKTNYTLILLDQDSVLFFLSAVGLSGNYDFFIVKDNHAGMASSYQFFLTIVEH